MRDYVNGLIRENVIALLVLLFPCPCLDMKSVGVAIRVGRLQCRGSSGGYFCHIYCKGLTWTHSYDTLANEGMTWCLCGDDMARMVMTNGDVDWAHRLIRECHLPTLESVFQFGNTHFTWGMPHSGNGTIASKWNVTCPIRLRFELSLCEKSLNLWS